MARDESPGLFLLIVISSEAKQSSAAAPPGLLRLPLATSG